MNKPISKYLLMTFDEFKTQLVALGDSKGVVVNAIAHNDALKGIFIFCHSLEEALEDYQDFSRRWKAVNSSFKG